MGRPSRLPPHIAGLALIGLAVLCLIVVQAVVAHPIVGDAVLLPVSGPPAVGDCVMQPIDPTWNQTEDPSTGEEKPYTYPQLRMQPCSSDRFGEVTGVIMTPKPVTSARSPDGQMETSDPNAETCFLSVSRFYGIAFTGAQLSPLAGEWYPFALTNVAFVRPSARQLATGQSWLACVVYRTVDLTQPAAPQERYRNTFRGDYTRGPQKEAITSCFANQVGQA